MNLSKTHLPYVRFASLLSVEKDDMRHRRSNDCKTHCICHGIQDAQVELTVVLVGCHVQGEICGHNLMNVVR